MGAPRAGSLNAAPERYTHPPLRGGRTPVPVADVTLAFTSVFAAAVIAIAAAFAFVPDVRSWLGAQGGLVAWLANATLASAIAVGIWAYLRSTDESRFRFLIPGTAALLLAQAFRFGFDAIGFDLPRVAGVEIGSLDDARAATTALAMDLGLGAIVGVLSIVLVAIGCTLAGIRLMRWARLRVRVTETAVVSYYTAALGCHIAIPAFGFFGISDGSWFASNMVALIGAGLLVVAGLAAGDHRTTVAGWRRRMWAWLGDEQPLTGSLERR